MEKAGDIFGFISMTDDDRLIFPSLREHQNFDRHSFLSNKVKDYESENPSEPSQNAWKLSDADLKDALESIYQDNSKIILAFLEKSTVTIQKFIENSKKESISPDLKKVLETKVLETNVGDIFKNINAGNLAQLGIGQDELKELEEIKDTPLKYIIKLEKDYSSKVWKEIAPKPDRDLSLSQVIQAIQEGDIKTLKIELDHFIELIADILKQRARDGEPVNIVQHPKGRRKEVVVSSNWTLLLSEKYVIYEADADFSSSGSPVFNQQWQLIALHNGAIIPSQSQQGVLIHKIVEDLQQKAIKELKGDADDVSLTKLIEEKLKSQSELQKFVDIFLPELSQDSADNPNKKSLRKNKGLERSLYFSSPDLFY